MRPRPIAAALITAGVVVVGIGLTGPALATPSDEASSKAKAKPSASASPTGKTGKTGKAPATKKAKTHDDRPGKDVVATRSTPAASKSSGKAAVKGWARVMTDPADPDRETDPATTADGPKNRARATPDPGASATPSASPFASKAATATAEATPDPDNSSPAATEPVITGIVEGDKTLAVTWSAPNSGSPTGYTVWVGGDVVDAGCDGLDPGTLTCTIDQGVVNEKSYAVEVAANMGEGEPVFSPAWWATPHTTQVTVPGAPVLGDIEVHGNKLMLSWNEPDDGGLPIIGYKIAAMRTSDSHEVPCVQSAGRRGTTCTITGMNDTEYSAKVMAWNSEGDGAASNEETATAASSVPGAPAVTANLSGTTVTVEAESSDTGGLTVDGYDIAVTKAGTQTAVTCTGTKTSEEPILYTGGTCTFESTQGESYTVKARAHNSVGYSTTATVTRTTAPAAPSAAIAVDGRVVTVSWTPHGTGGATILGYVVAVTRDGQQGSVPCAGTMGTGDHSDLYTGTSCTFTGIPGQQYSVSVKARNSVDTSAIAGTDQKEVPPLAGPANVKATPGDTKATVTWTPITPATGITGYVVSYTKEGGQAHPEPVSGADKGSLEVTGLENLATYSITVKAVLSEGTVAESAAVLVTPSAPPVIPATAPEPDGTLTAPAGATTPDPGEQITISGSGFAPNSQVAVVIYSTPHNLGTVITNQSGAFSLAVTVPHGLSGSHTITSIGVDSNGAVRVLSLGVTITGSGGGSGSGSGLAITGAPVVTIVLTGILLIAAGGTTRFVGRHRRP